MGRSAARGFLRGNAGRHARGADAGARRRHSNRQPRELDSEQKEALWALSRLALGQMELRQNLQLLKEALNDRTREEHAREKELKRLEEKLIRVMGLKI